MQLKIGNTPLVPLTTLAGAPIQGTVLIKDESKNPTGTHKDRKSQYLVEQAIKNNVDTLVIITSGNAGYSLATIAEQTRLKIVTIISQHLAPTIKAKLRETKAHVIECDLTQELTSAHIIKMARTHVYENIWDVTNCGHEAYRQVYDEIANEQPDLVIVPLGSGELYLGIDEGMQQGQSTSTLLGVHPRAVQSTADKLCTPYRPLQSNILQTQFNRAIVGQLRGRASITENEIQWCINNAPEGLQAEPSALVPLHMVHRLQKKALKIIMVSTGKGLQ